MLDCNCAMFQRNPSFKAITRGYPRNPPLTYLIPQKHDLNLGKLQDSERTNLNLDFFIRESKENSSEKRRIQF